MPKKYHIASKTAPPRENPIGKYATVEFRENCAGSCRECVKKKCVSRVFEENYQHVIFMEEPEYRYTCQSCFRCVQECTNAIFSRVIDPAYRTLGDDYWRADILNRTWYQAHTGNVPVSGSGYRGPFSGHGFDSMWTDMSEIIRPTRDGIHGREYINTCIELSRRPERLEFDENMNLVTDVPPLLEIPLPALMQQPDFGVLSPDVLLSMVRATHELGTMMFIQAEDFTEALKPFAKHLIPCLTQENAIEFIKNNPAFRMIELAYTPGIEDLIKQLRDVNSALFIAVGIPLRKNASLIALEMTHAGADTLHFYADHHGNELNTAKPRFLKEMIREIHLFLVEKHVRHIINLVFSGGIAMPEHWAKAIICGADGVTVDDALLIAMECNLCHRCQENLPCPVKLETVNPDWGSQRIINLMGAWRNQLLEVMGAMGICEARRLRGEVGRSLWFEDLERESFGPIFGERKV
ncbi:glutamate synthase-related protein [Desulfococcaceae bacterium HSG9]|nr:glutamate synthase-related protein [Desulfococcaceae bacterium HSG9]